MKPYSLDLRERVLADCDGGLSTQTVARKYRVSPAWVRRLKQRRRQTGDVAPRTPRRPPPTWSAHAQRIDAAVRDQPDLTLEELRTRLGLTFSLATLWRAVRSLGLTVKKK
jgi:transposase